MADKRSGRCLCGAVRVTVTDPEPHLNACHCSMCRRWTGLAFVTLDVPEGQIEIEGAEAVKAFTSSDWAQRCFCGICGSTLWYRLTAPGAPTDYYMAAGLLDDLSGLTLANEIYIDCKPEAFAFAGPTRQITEAEFLAMLPPPAAKE
ncbi:GFA family protein [Pseudogemmobacter blasticus]|uniref:Aldehyde-activating protein n=1 Tax=Fuscovulum blasticum DSM 2131 TaxID=1188250 RepID=A0A2T4JEH9_FUSBL|nr:GFA family protein [Fuscovulum blasticum]PTE16325.1 aldehyde-activating protein [Fuscovulum blasticum DSM 2131]